MPSMDECHGKNKHAAVWGVGCWARTLVIARKGTTVGSVLCFQPTAELRWRLHRKS